MWLEKKHIYTDFWGWQTSTQLRIPMETPVTGKVAAVESS